MPLLSLFALLLALALPARAADLPDRVAFSVALEAGNLGRAREWLEGGLDPNFEGAAIGTGIMIGAWEGNIALMELFHAHGADVNRTNALGEQALLHAAWKGRLEAVRWLVEHGARIDRQGRQWAALHYAAFAGHDDVVSYLLARGANANALSTNGSTPLMMAAREGREGIATRLLAAGARGDVVNEWGEDATRWALRHNNTRIARMIAGADYPRAAAAHAAAQPPAVAQRSLPAPGKADALLAQARALEAAGKRGEALQLFRAALAALREAEKPQAARPAPRIVSGLAITARRADPSAQTYTLQLAAPPGVPPKVSPGGTAVAARDAPPPATKAGLGASPASAKPAPPAEAKPQDAAEDWLRRARELEAGGQRREALEAFRKAAAALRGR